jgi:hypothetical protein
MKHIILCIAFFCTYTSIHAQHTSQSATYDTCIKIRQYAGEWIYADGIDTIRICLRYHRDSSAEDAYVRDKLWGWHEYKRGNTIIESDYQNRFMQIPSDCVAGRMLNYCAIALYLKPCGDTNRYIDGIIFDYLQADEDHVVTIEPHPGNQTMTWRQRHSEWYGALTGAKGMTLPREFLLRRVQ